MANIEIVHKSYSFELEITKVYKNMNKISDNTFYSF